MSKLKKYIVLLLSMFVLLVVVGCTDDEDETASVDDKYSYTYDDMPLYSVALPVQEYKLTPLSNDDFYQLSDAEQEIIADKLLSTFYFGMPREEIVALLGSGVFINTIHTMISETRNDLAAAEERLNDNGDEGEFYFSDWSAGAEEVAKILARFYVLDELDKEYINYWSAYVLTSTIMFSPAYELESTHNPNIERVYSSLVRAFRDEYTLEYTTFLHMISDDNWRRFRSPEDNGREMMEIYLQDFNDSRVPIAAQALKNWHLDRDNDTLVIGLDENTQPVELYGKSIVDGYDFYRTVVTTSEFVKQVSARVVDIYFPTFTSAQKDSIVTSIVSSDPGTWQDILLQVVFSKQYLLDSDKPKAAEELFFSLSKKIYFKHRRGFFSYFAGDLTDMNQASMKYKLGKYVEVPLDTQSFITYHKTMREDVFIRYNNETDDRGGWLEELLIPDQLFEGISAYEHTQMLTHLIDHLFLTVLAREATTEEKNLFIAHMIDEEGNYIYPFRLFKDDNSINERRYASIIIMDYLSRLAQNYRFERVLDE